MKNVHPIELVVIEGVPYWDVRGMGLVVRHQQQAQAHLQWYCQATARGWSDPAPVVRP